MYNFCRNECLKTLQRLETVTEKCSEEKTVLNIWGILKNYKSVRNPLNMLEGAHIL